MQIILDPASNIYYASFYIQGFIALYDKQSIRFNASRFMEIEDRVYNFNIIVITPDREMKVSIDYEDSNRIHEPTYRWCDIYGKVNAHYIHSSKEQYPKLVSLAPGFGIRLWPLIQTVRMACFNTIKSGGDLSQIRKLLGKYKRQYTLRLPIGYYHPKSYLDNRPYVYHLSTLWHSDQWNKNDEGVNKSRANFIRACKRNSAIEFEGGLVPQNKNRSSIDLFKDVLFEHEVNVKEYIAKTQQSWIVFNTPAFWNCHGWKLGEFLALGKAIISTPLSNELPAPLVHGEQIHFIQDDSEEEIGKAVELLMGNPAYRQKLEKGAHQYWEKYGTPVQAVKLLGL